MFIKKIFYKQKFYLILISLFFFALLAFYSFVSEGCEGGMDSYNHYLISKYTWKYPHLLLDQWGKPLYNLIASPFANIGFIGVKLFNILLWIGSAWLTWLTSRKLNLKYSWIAFLIVLLPQVSYQNTISGLTEYLNEFLLISFVYFIAIKKWNIGAAIAGLLPFARSEGFVIMAATAFYLVFIVKEYKSLLWFVAGSVFFSLLGLIIYGDILWIFTNNPYIIAQAKGMNLCGNGSLFHYVKLSRFIFSIAGVILLVAGSVISFILLFKGNKNDKFRNNFIFWLCCGIFWLFFAVHSIIWWKGIMGSCGYTRVMIVITPLAALIGNYSISYLTETFSKLKYHIIVFTIVLMLISISHLYQFSKKNLPYTLSDEQKEFVKVADWLKTYDYKGRMIYFLYPYLNILANIDPYDKKHFEFLWSFDFKYSPLGSLIIWDAHFGPNECKIPLEKLMNNSDFELIKSFKPEKPFKTLNEYPFEIYIFKRVKI
ncbi:MAG: hypothetical protein HUU47_04045 [Bacteroidetes bacterium]|nr:hypothetical protein [Bacteroidota bacterium]